MKTKKICKLPPEQPAPPVRENKTSLLYWWPRVKDLGIPVPVTHILPVCPTAFLDAMDGKPLPPSLVVRMRDTAKLLGYPLFLRTDLQSGKHGWDKTCFVLDEYHLVNCAMNVAQENEMGACFFGPSYSAFVFREFLQLEASFVAFYGNLPVNKERRYFIRAGEVICRHPYWPHDAVRGHTKDKKWRQKLGALNFESPEEIELLSRYARTVGTVMPEYWSVDFAMAKDGTWYLIDMALGDESFHWEGCPHSS